ncbi:MAG: TonB-dependent receptor [Bacteroidia bacterium]
MMTMRVSGLLVSVLFCMTESDGQNAGVYGKISDKNGGLAYATVGISSLGMGTAANDSGNYLLSDIPPGKHEIRFSMVGYQDKTLQVNLSAGQNKKLDITLEEAAVVGDDIVISGTLSPVSRDKSPVAIEVYRPAFFLKNPTPNLFEALQSVNGVRPQVNCSICNTGDIHLNGLEGPYTMVTIDGMPIVSGLGTVYGLSGIPNALVERIEIIKGPASTLYGSEAVGGLINVVTKDPTNAPRFAADYFVTGWGEHNLDLGTSYGNKTVKHLLGINLFRYATPFDRNGDGFTDLALSTRGSLFHKSSWKTKAGQAQFAVRGVYEARWGGQLNWTPEWAGSDSVYGETITTKRGELLGALPFRIGKDTLVYQISASWHYQDSWYGKTPYIGDQRIIFQQLLWHKPINAKHRILSGIAARYTWYDDNTPATESISSGPHRNNPSRIFLPGIFVQHSWFIDATKELLTGIRYDYNSIHGSILSPRVNYKWEIKKIGTFRLGAGNGYRVANVFTEDHAALTGARKVVFASELKPERSWNMNLQWRRFFSLKKGFIQTEAALFYTYFHNKIIPDYLSNPSEIRYDNLPGHAISQGIQGNIEWIPSSKLRSQVGFTWMHNYTVYPGPNGEEIKATQLLTERFSSTWSISYQIPFGALSVDYTGNLYSPMHLPVQSASDPREPMSPWYSIQNLQLTKEIPFGFSLYAGVKNLLNFTPAANSIARANDPFNKQVEYDAQGIPVSTANNPNGLIFDPSYVYTSFQGRRYFIGLRWKWA